MVFGPSKTPHQFGQWNLQLFGTAIATHMDLCFLFIASTFTPPNTMDPIYAYYLSIITQSVYTWAVHMLLWGIMPIFPQMSRFQGKGRFS